MKKYSHVLLWATGMLLLVAHGCVQTVEIAPPEEKQVFVKCILEKGSYKQQVILLYSGGIGEKRFEPVTNATVSISGYKRFHAFQHVGDGVYEGRLEPMDGETYTLKAIIPGRDTLEATTTMPPAFSIDAQLYPPEEWLFEEDWGILAVYSFYIWTNPWAKHYDPDTYGIMKEMEGSSMHAEMPGIVFQADSLEHHHLYILGRFEDSTGVIAPIRQLATNHMLVDHVNANGGKYHVADNTAYSDTASRPKYETLIKRHYEGLALHDGYLRIDSPTNYDNGLRNIHNLRVREEEAPFLIEARYFFVVVGDFEYNYWGPYAWDEKHPVLYFCSVSEEYDRYLRSVQAALVDTEGDLLSTLYGEAGGYSNVHGGFGAFGAVSTLRYDCDLKLGLSDSSIDLIGYLPYPPYPALLPEL